MINRLSQLMDTIPFVDEASYQEYDEDEHCFKDIDWGSRVSLYRISRNGEPFSPPVSQRQLRQRWGDRSNASPLLFQREFTFLTYACQTLRRHFFADRF